MVASVSQRHRDVDHGEAERTLRHRVLDALLDRRDPLFRYGAARNLFLETESFAAGQRPDFDNDVAELAMAARLLLVPAAFRDRPPDRLAIADRRRMMFYLDSVTALQLGDRGLQMLVINRAKPPFMARFVLLQREA